MWTDTKDNKFQPVKQCIQVWQAFSSFRKKEIMLHYFRVRHNYQTYPSVATCPNTSFCTVLCAHCHFTHPEQVPMFWQMLHIFMVKTVPWHLRRWHTWFSSWCQGDIVYLNDSVLFLSLSDLICIVVSRISLGHMHPAQLSILKSAVIVV
jgi:hypothetical protein